MSTQFKSFSSYLPWNTHTHQLSTDQKFNGGFNRQKSFGTDKDRKSFQARQAQQREQQHIQLHTFLHPAWNNSFGKDNPIHAIINIVLIIIFVLYMIRTQGSDTTVVYTFGGIILLSYLAEVFTNGVIDTLNNIMSLSEYEDHVNQMRKSRITINYKVTAYHNEKVQTYDRKTKTYSTHTNKIETYSENFKLPIASAADQTQDSMIYFEKANFMRVYTFSTYSYLDSESERKFEELKKFAEVKASQMDSHFTANEEVNIPGIKTHILVHVDGTKIDLLLSKPIYFIYCLVGLGLLYRIFVNRRVSFLEYCLHKKISYDESREPQEFQEQRLKDVMLRQQAQILENQQIIIQQNDSLISNQNAQITAITSEEQVTPINPII